MHVAPCADASGPGENHSADRPAGLCRGRAIAGCGAARLTPRVPPPDASPLDKLKAVSASHSPPDPPPTHVQLGKALRELRLGVDPAELHGALSGYLCGGGRVGSDWLAALEIDTDDATAARHPLLDRMQRECRAQFAHLPAVVQPLLPEGAALSQRADALVEWCRGFLGGFGLAAAADGRPLSDEVQEILGDIGMIAASSFETTQGAEDERALADVLDFVRMAAAILHREVRDAAAPSLH